MKKIVFTIAALAIAIGVGIAVFKWTGSDMDELRRKGAAIEEQLRQTGHRGAQATDEVKKPATPSSPQPSTPTQVNSPSPSPVPTTPPKKNLSAPPMEEVNDKDKKQLKGILDQ